MTDVADDRKPDFKRVRLTGTRFEGGRLPIDSLVELQKYQEVVRIAAEAEWRRDHPGGAIPEEFRETVSLAIERIDDGSADIFLAFEQQSAYVEYQAEAQDAADAFITAVYAGAPLPELPAMSPDQGREFRDAVAHIGASLEASQAIEFYAEDPSLPPVSITIETRPRAVQHLTRIDDDFMIAPVDVPGPSRSEASLVGRVTEINADKLRFALVLADGEEIHGWYREQPQLLEDFREVVNNAAEGPLTRITGDLQIRGGQPWRFWEAHSIERVEFDDTRWGARLAEFAALQRGWDGGHAAQITSTSLDAAQKLLQAVPTQGIEGYGVFPTDEGGVLLERASQDEVRSVEILPDGSFELFSLRADQSQGEHAESIDLRDAARFIGAVE
jgi:hypothetical protein